MISFEQFAIQRLAKCAKITTTPELENSLKALLQSAQEGKLFCSLDTTLPESLCAKGEIEPTPTKPLISYGNKLYLHKHWMLETMIVHKVYELFHRPLFSFDPVRFQKALQEEKEHLNEAQIKAIEKGFINMLTLFSGGPGTGKTYTAASFIRILAATQDSCRVILSAPTGKAAAHLESILRSKAPHLTWQSMTLHRLLKLRPNRQKLFSSQTIDADLVVVDEASMMDGYLLLHLLQAIGPNTRLLLLGDADQLPPVEGISFFPDIAEYLGQKLSYSVRMGEGGVRKISQAILERKTEEIPLLSWPANVDLLKDFLCKQLFSPYHAKKPDLDSLFQELNRFRILCALRQGPFGVDSLNQQILTYFQKQSVLPWLAIPILISQNSIKLDLYNGTPGILLRYNGRGTAYFLCENGLRSIEEKALPSYELAFCLSIHKSQGSEFEEVIVIFGPGSERFGNEALYTAVTRAKKKVQICADAASFQAAIEKNVTQRSSFLERIKRLDEEARKL